MLFIGESPPASGRFFYLGDSGLYRAMRDVFRKADPSIGDEHFLNVFQRSGCYLIDLCPEPVDDMDPVSRRLVCRNCEPALATVIARLQPAAIATLLRSIEGNVLRATSRATWNGPRLHLPYPGRWSRYRVVFEETLVPWITPLLRTGAL